MSKVYLTKEKAVKERTKHDQPAELFPYRCYRIGEVLYVPHYEERYFVGPGYPGHIQRIYTNLELIAAGGKQETHLLLKRREHKEVGHNE